MRGGVKVHKPRANRGVGEVEEGRTARPESAQVVGLSGRIGGEVALTGRLVVMGAVLGEIGLRDEDGFDACILPGVDHAGGVGKTGVVPRQIPHRGG